MDQDDGKESVAALEEWYSLYLNADESELGPILESCRLEPVSLEAAEVRVAEAMKETTVVGGFCSTCQSMLDNWPDFAQYDVLARFKEDRKRHKSGISPALHGPGSDSRFWIHPEHGLTVDLPYQDDIVRQTASARNGCKFCAMYIGFLKDIALDVYIIYVEIDRRLHKLGKSSQLHMAISSFSEYRYKSGYPLPHTPTPTHAIQTFSQLKSLN